MLFLLPRVYTFRLSPVFCYVVNCTVVNILARRLLRTGPASTFCLQMNPDGALAGSEQVCLSAPVGAQSEPKEAGDGEETAQFTLSS